MLRLILKMFKWVMVFWMEQMSSKNWKKRAGTVIETGIRREIKKETGIVTGGEAIERGIEIKTEIETETGGEREIGITSGIETVVTEVKSERKELLIMVWFKNLQQRR